MAKEFGEGNLLRTNHLEHLGGLTLKGLSDVTPKSIKNRIFRVGKLAAQEIPNETLSECGELLDEGGHRPAKRPRVSATKRASKETRAKKLRKGKATSATDEEDVGGAPIKSENKDTQALGAEDIKAEDTKAEGGKNEDAHDLGVEVTKVEDGKNEDTEVETGFHEKQPNGNE